MTATITVTGGLTSAPEIRYTSSGQAVANGTVASTERYKKDNEWVDGKRLYLRWSAWRDIAEHIAASNLDKGAQVTVTGKLHTREYQAQDGSNRTSTELEVTDFAVSLKRATVHVTPAQSNQSQQRTTPPVQQQQGDVWGAPAADYSDPTPF